MVLSVIAHFREPHAAHIARCLLEANDVTAFVFDEQYIGVNWLISNAIGGVKLAVEESDRATAVQLLAAPVEELAVQGAELDRCPICESHDLIADTFDHRFRAISLWIGFPLGIGQYRFHCNSCAHDWRERPSHRSIIFRIADVFALTWIALLAIVLLPVRLVRRLLETRNATQLTCWSCEQVYHSDASECPSCGIQLPPMHAYARVIEIGRPYDATCSSCHTPYDSCDYQGSLDDWRCSICSAALADCSDPTGQRRAIPNTGRTLQP